MASVMSCLQAFAKFPLLLLLARELSGLETLKHWRPMRGWGLDTYENLIANKIGSCITGKIFREFGKIWRLWQLRHDIHAENDLDLQIYNEFMQRMLKD